MRKICGDFKRSKALRMLKGSAVLTAVLFAAASFSGCSGAEKVQGSSTEAAAASEAESAKETDTAKENAAGLPDSEEETKASEAESTAALETKESAALEAKEDASSGAEEGTSAADAAAKSDSADKKLMSEVKHYGQTLSKEEVFSAMSDWQFEFSSGAGAWQTYLTVEPDGSFQGEFSDANLGETGEGYEENGTTYISQFSGRFTEAKEIRPYVYELKLGDVTLKNEAGTELIADGRRIVFSEPYGVQGTDTLTVFLPGTPLSDLPETYLNWIEPLHFGYYVSENFYKDHPEDLPFCGIYNEKQDCGFFSADRAEKNLRFLVNRATYPDLVSRKAELYEDGTYRYEDMDPKGMHEVINLCFNAREKADGTEFPAMNLYPKSFVQSCLEELGVSPANEDTLYYFTRDDAEWYAPILYINGKDGIYALWTSGSNEDTRSWAARMTQIGDHVYVYALGLSQYEELFAGEAAHFFQTSLTFSGRSELLSSAPEKRAEECINAAGTPEQESAADKVSSGTASSGLHSIFARVQPEGEDKIRIRELLFVSSDDEELIKEYGLDPGEMTDDYAIVEKTGETERTLEVSENCPVYVQYPEEGTFRSLISPVEISAYAGRFSEADLNMTLILDEDDRVVFMYQNYTP